MEFYVKTHEIGVIVPNASWLCKGNLYVICSAFKLEFNLVLAANISLLKIVRLIRVMGPVRTFVMSRSGSNSEVICDIKRVCQAE